MIAKKHRFHGHNSVSRVRGSAVRLQLFSVFYAKNKQADDFRMAVVVSKKVSKLAVERNTIRRRLYELVRTGHVLDGLAVDTVFVVHSHALLDLSAKDLEGQVAKACQQIAGSTLAK